MPERRKLDRRDFSQYMRIMNEQTGELIGHLSDLSTGGFKLECKKPIVPNQEFLMRLDLTGDISTKDYMVFVARSRWCKKDNIDPTLYDVGFQLIEMNPGDLVAFKRMFENYGSQKNNNRNTKKNSDYFWR
jgi:hypothetical protein